MSNTRNPDDPEAHKVALRRVYQSVPALDPPRDWSEVMRDVLDEMALPNALKGLPRESPEFKLYSERLAEFMGVIVVELELTNEHRRSLMR